MSEYRRKWTKDEAIQGLTYIYDIYGLAPARSAHYLYLVLLEQQFGASLRLPLPETIYKFWPNIRDAWRSAGRSPIYSIRDLKLEFPFSVEIDDDIKSVYATHRTRDARLSALVAVSTKHQLPIPALALRAGQLELDGHWKIDWTEPEIAILKSCAHLSKQTISSRLEAAGFRRSFQSGRIIKARRQQLVDPNPSHYSREQLSYLIGFNSKHLGHWLSQGLLPYEMKGTVRTSQQGGDTYLIKRDDVARLFRAHPELLDLRKVNQKWLIALLRETDQEFSNSATHQL